MQWRPGVLQSGTASWVALRLQAATLRIGSKDLAPKETSYRNKKNGKRAKSNPELGLGQVSIKHVYLFVISKRVCSDIGESKIILIYIQVSFDFLQHRTQEQDDYLTTCKCVFCIVSKQSDRLVPTAFVRIMFPKCRVIPHVSAEVVPKLFPLGLFHVDFVFCLDEGGMDSSGGFM